MYDSWLKNNKKTISEIENICKGDKNLLRNYKEGLVKDCYLRREQEYPPITDFIDAYFWEKNGDSSLMEAYLNKIKDIKQKYPKPFK